MKPGPKVRYSGTKMADTGGVLQQAASTHVLSDHVCPGEMQHSSLLTLDRVRTTDQKTDQRTDTIQVHFDEPVNFIAVTYKTTTEALLTGAEVTQRQVQIKAPTPAQVIAHKAGYLEQTA